MALCWGKHGNPALQKAVGVAATPEAHVLNLDPILGGRAHRIAEFALWLMLEPVVTYILSLYKAGMLSDEAFAQGGALLQLWRPFNDRMSSNGSGTV